MDFSTIPRDVLVDAMTVYMLSVMTQPLTLGEVADAFGVHRSRARAIIDGTTGAEQCGNHWRLPMHKMPVPFQREAGFL